jgi:hypothetical protein
METFVNSTCARQRLGKTLSAGFTHYSPLKNIILGFRRVDYQMIRRCEDVGIRIAGHIWKRIFQPTDSQRSRPWDCVSMLATACNHHTIAGSYVLMGIIGFVNSYSDWPRFDFWGDIKCRPTTVFGAKVSRDMWSECNARKSPNSFI